MNLVQTLPPGCWLVIRTTIGLALTNEWNPVPQLIKEMDLFSRLMPCEKFQNTLDYNIAIKAFPYRLVLKFSKGQRI